MKQHGQSMSIPTVYVLSLMFCTKKKSVTVTNHY